MSLRIYSTLFLIAAGVAGCAETKKSSPGTPKDSRAQVAPPIVTPIEPPRRGDAAALADRTAAYAKTITASMKNPATEPAESQVKWSEPPAKAKPTTAAAATIKVPEARVIKQPTVAVASAPGNANEPLSVGDAAAPAVASVNIGGATTPPVEPLLTFADQLLKRTKENPRDVSAALDYQLYLFLKGDTTPNLGSLAALPTEDREVVTALLDGLNNFRSTVRADNNLLMSAKVRPLNEMSDRLRTQTDLNLPTMALCSKVEGFGRYEPMPTTSFPANKEQPAVVYCEVDNFASRQTDAGQWQTDLVLEVNLYDESGMRVWTDKSATVQDMSRNRRRDFFVRKLVRFPAGLGVGRYVLKATVTDSQVNRVAESSVDVQYVAQ